MKKKTLLTSLGAAVICVAVYASVTPNMGLTLPTVGVTTGPEWASQINAAFQAVDAHTHAPGSGIQISNAGVSTTAAIARSKLASGGGSLVLINDTSGVMSSESTLAVTRGGTNIGSYTIGDILYACSSTGLCKLPIGTANQLLKTVGGLPTWATTSPGATPTVQSFTSGTGTYTRPAPAPAYIQVEMVGGGGGGGAQATNAGITGGTTTFACGTLSATGGIGAAAGGTTGGLGGTASLGTGIGFALTGGSGGSGSTNPGTNIAMAGGIGGASCFSGGGFGGTSGGTSGVAPTNTGSGGGGASGGNAAPSGPGGGAGGCVKAIVAAPAATCAYAVGAGGAGGTAGTLAGGAAAAGIIVVTEYY